jgi:hypothetical protein
LPLPENEVDNSTPFTPAEPLFRRVLPSEELSDGEIDPTRLNSVSFKKEIQSAPSVLRGLYASPEDALHKDCANQKDVTGQFVYYVGVGDLPDEIKSDDGKMFNVFPLHFPVPTCGAHSVISCCRKGDGTRAYEMPSPSARYDLRVKLAAKLQKIRFAAATATQGPTVTNT